ncbi:zinc ribbon domain-containing protein [bacterium]|nr:zinc ribbon domain-containing protein [bacterium]
MYDRARAAMHNRGKPKKFRRGTKYHFTFRGLLTCAECGRFVTAETKKGHIYYHCTKRNKDYDCRQPFIREEALASEFTTILDRLAVMPESWIENMLS